MSEVTDLWVCPRCHVLQGIEVWKVDGDLNARCVNCGVPLDIDSVDFITPKKARDVINIVEDQVPSEFHDYIRYSWVSNRTVGLIFELSLDELASEVDFDPLSFFEDEVGPELGLTMTVYFEY